MSRKRRQTAAELLAKLNQHPVLKLTGEQLVDQGEKILWHFSHGPEGDGGRTFGWDWSTMRICFPELCAKYDELKLAWRLLCL